MFSCSSATNHLKPLSPEYYVDSLYPGEDPDKFAQWCLTEARSLFAESTCVNWKLEYDKKQVNVWSRPVEGGMGLMTRTAAVVNASATDVFNLMISTKSFEIIDPSTKNHDEPPLEIFKWRSRMDRSCARQGRYTVASLEPRIPCVQRVRHRSARAVQGSPVVWLKEHPGPKLPQNAGVHVRVEHVCASDGKHRKRHLQAGNAELLPHRWEVSDLPG